MLQYRLLHRESNAEGQVKVCSSHRTCRIRTEITFRPLDIDDTTVQLVEEMAKIPSALKAWRPPFLDLMNDTRIFNSSAAGALRWRLVVRTLFNSDKPVLQELLGTDP